jgi:hypothetical protein
MHKRTLIIAAAMIAAAAAVAAIAADFTVTVVSGDGTTIAPPASAAAPSLADAASPAASYIETSEGRWTFGSPPDAAGDYPLLLNGSAAAGGLAAISAQVTNGNLYARTKASGHYWCRFAAAWYDVGAPPRGKARWRCR